MTAPAWAQRNAAWIAVIGTFISSLLIIGGGALLAQQHDLEHRTTLLEATTPLQLDNRINQVNGSILLLNQKVDSIVTSTAAMAQAMNNIRPATMAAIPSPHRSVP